MARLSKQEQKLHDRVMELINSDRPLTYEEKEFCYNNYHGDGLGGSGAFFTPEGLAWDFTIDAHLRCYVSYVHVYDRQLN